MQPQTRDAYARLLEQGWMDSARALHPRERMYTYWTTERAFSQNKGFRMDFVLVNGPLKARVTAAGVDADYRGGVKPSDHAPAWIELRPRSGSRTRVPTHEDTLVSS
jgi:exodeoxyribonuclease-3